MSIDEAIAHAREVSSEQKRRSGVCIQNDSECDKFSACLKCAEEHEQLAEWLEELKEYKNKNPYQKYVDNIANTLVDAIKNLSIEDINMYKIGYNKAIYDLLEDANEMAIEVDTGTYTMKAIGIGLLEQIAEQLKAGGTDEMEK